MLGGAFEQQGAGKNNNKKGGGGEKGFKKFRSQYSIKIHSMFNILLIVS